MRKITEQNNKQATLIPSLQGARGIAALVVAVFHCLFIIRQPFNPEPNPFMLQSLSSFEIFVDRLVVFFFNGYLAMSLFFVLSGVVLGFSLDKHIPSIKTFWAFIFKRFMRLYPVYLPVVILGALYLTYFHGFHGTALATINFPRWYTTPTSWERVVSDLLLQGTYFNYYAWSMRVEFFAALIFPILYILARKSSVVIDLFVLMILIIIASETRNFGPARYFYMFYIGLLVPRTRLFFQNNRYFKSPRVTSVTVLGTLMILLELHYLFGQYSLTRQVIESLGIAGIFGALLYTKEGLVNGFLSSRFCQFFGRVAYSFYLLHFLILRIEAKVILEGLAGIASSRQGFLIDIALALVTVASTALVARYAYRYIEKPALELAPRINSWLLGKLSAFSQLTIRRYIPESYQKARAN